MSIYLYNLSLVGTNLDAKNSVIIYIAYLISLGLHSLFVKIGLIFLERNILWAMRWRRFKVSTKKGTKKKKKISGDILVVYYDYQHKTHLSSLEEGSLWREVAFGFV